MYLVALFTCALVICLGIRKLVYVAIDKFRMWTFIRKTRGPSLVEGLRHASEYRTRTLQIANAFCARYGYELFSLFTLRLGALFIVSNPEDVAVVIKSKDLSEKCHFYYNDASTYTKKNILVNNGELWSYCRRTIDQGFHNKALESYMSTFNEGSQDWLIDMQKLFIGKTSDMLAVILERLMFSSPKVILGRDFNNVNAKKWCRTVKDLFMLTHKNALEPLFFAYKCLLRHHRKTVKNAYNILETHTKFFTEHKETVKNLLESDEEFSPSSMAEHIVVKNESGQQKLTISDEQLCIELSFISCAAAETSAATLTLVLAMLALHPEIQRGVREEVQSIFDGSDSDRPVTMDDVKRMHFLDRVNKETMRLYPAIPFIARRVKEDTDINGSVVPKGASIAVNIMALHRNPKCFENPDQFDPSRFLPESIHKIHPYGFIPFSAGLRKCPGKQYAMIQLKIYIASLMRKFEVLPSQNLKSMDDIQVDFHFTIYFLKKIELCLQPIVPQRNGDHANERTVGNRVLCT